MGRWIQCKQCGHTYKNTIKRCPQCFQRTPATAKQMILTAISVLLLVGFVGGLIALALTSSAPSNVNTQTTTSVTTSTITTGASATSATKQGVTMTTKRGSNTTNTDPQTTLQDADGAVSGTKAGKVYITFPKWLMLAADADFDYQLSDADKEMGFSAVRKNADGSATYTLNSYNDYSRCRLEMGGKPKATCVGWKFQGIVKDFKYNDTLSEVSLYTRYTSYDQMDQLDVSMIMALGFQIMLYQYIDMDVPVCSVISVYGADGQLLGTSTFPQAGITFYETYRK